jgi:hypothetical protein
MPVDFLKCQKLKRWIKVSGLDMPLIATITEEGIVFKVKGGKLGVRQGWDQIVATCNTPPNVQQFLAGKPIKYLQHVSSRIVRNKIKKEGGDVADTWY